jgi:hypothetical protein
VAKQRRGRPSLVGRAMILTDNADAVLEHDLTVDHDERDAF